MFRISFLNTDKGTSQVASSLTIVIEGMRYSRARPTLHPSANITLKRKKYNLNLESPFSCHSMKMKSKHSK